MIKFFIFCIGFLLLYLGFTAAIQLDSNVVINAYDYKVTTTFFTLIAFLIVTILIVFIALRIIFFFFELPSFLQKKLIVSKSQRNIQDIMHAMASIIAGDKSQAYIIAKKLASNSLEDYNDLLNIILAMSASNLDDKLSHLRALLTSNRYRYFATKEIAKTYLENRYYQQAEEYAINAFNFNDSDEEIIETLIECYAQMKIWSKFSFTVSKLLRENKEQALEASEKLAAYYLQAAKDTLADGEDKGAAQYLEAALELKPDFIEAIELYTSLNVCSRSNNLSILEAAFAANPCFQLAEIYIKLSNLPASRLYDNLASLANPKQYIGVFLSIAAYLDLAHKIQDLKETKLLPATFDEVS